MLRIYAGIFEAFNMIISITSLSRAYGTSNQECPAVCACVQAHPVVGGHEEWPSGMHAVHDCSLRRYPLPDPRWGCRESHLLFSQPSLSLCPFTSLFTGLPLLFLFYIPPYLFYLKFLRFFWWIFSHPKPFFLILPIPSTSIWWTRDNSKIVSPAF